MNTEELCRLWVLYPGVFLGQAGVFSLSSLRPVTSVHLSEKPCKFQLPLLTPPLFPASALWAKRTILAISIIRKYAAMESASRSPLNGAAAVTNGSVRSDGDAREASQLQASPASDASGSKPLRRRNKPSLSCKTCTVSRIRSPIDQTVRLTPEAGQEDKGKKTDYQQLRYSLPFANQPPQSSVTEADQRMSNAKSTCYLSYLSNAPLTGVSHA